MEKATKLVNELESGQPYIPTWLDKRELRPGSDWDDAVFEAIRDSKCLLFLMTEDSTAEGSTCKIEWTWALKYKKPVIPILVDKKVQLPFIGSRQWIDFTLTLKQVLLNSRKQIAYLGSEEGKLDELKHRLEDANRDLRRAKVMKNRASRGDIYDLKKQIERRKKFWKTRGAAKKQTEQNIQNGLERERKPQLPVASFQSSKFINQPPGVAQNYFQDRLMETEQAILFLKNEAQRVLTVVGRGGAGKTAMVLPFAEVRGERRSAR
ncbi:MAG: toll/interleukin-1 receptor domain-containing protein [Anaerolineales bacterium]|nr:toll/interleukin-1 receptor domain-containing protein [Anaerolineales bacterium]